MVNELTKEDAKEAILLLASNNNNEELFKLLLSSVISKITSFSSDSSAELSELLPCILNSVRSLQNPISILFQLLEHLPQRRDEIARLKILEILSTFEFSVANIINLLYKSDTDAVISDILKAKENMVDEFIRNSLRLDNPTVAKNLSSLLPSLDPKFFVNYNSFLFLFESESHHLRNCLLDMFQVLVQSFKENENIEAIREITHHISERLRDANFYVRSKALGVIGELFKTECVLKDQRNALIKEIVDRARDKTVIVRKKSVNLLTQILINHPFRDRESLDRADATAKNMTETQRRIAEDFDEFVGIMESCLSLVTSLLDCNLKTDLVEISGFIKASYLLKLKGAKEAVQKILGVVFTKDRHVVIETFKDILSHRGEVLFEFINDRAFEVVLGCLEIDEKILYRNIFNGHRVFEGVYVLRHIQKSVSESNALNLLQYITDILFKSKDEETLKVNIETYINTLCILKNLRRRVDCSGDMFALCTKNAIKMVFFERSIIKHTVELIYCTSSNPEVTVGKFLKNLCLTKSTLKIVDAIGWVALNQFYLLERLERSLKSGKGAVDRLSLANSSAIRKSLEDSKSMGNIREKRKSLEESRRVSLSSMSFDKGYHSSGGRLSLRFDELEETLKNKTDEEVADFFFYLKEKEILYSETSALHQFIPLLMDSLKNPNPDIQSTAHSSLFKCMLISSEFFNEHKSILLEALDSPCVAVKNNAVIAFHDFLIFYNTSLDPSVIFDKLKDKDVSKNAALAIFNLLHKNIIRLKNNAVHLASLLFDESLGSIIKTLVKCLSGNNNAISIVFYEAFTSSLGAEFVKYLAPFVPESIHESLFLKCLNNYNDIEKLKAIYENFELSEKFIKENLFREEMKMLSDRKPAV